MSNIQNFENLKQIVQMVQPQFDELAQIHKAVNYKREASFALQILQENDFLAGVAMKNQDSLKRAVLNVAAVGLSLSPVFKLAYLVPRKNKVCLDISYLGYIQLAVEVGSIKWAHSEVVYDKDDFQLRGLGVEPHHSFSPFGERGKIVGAYCVVKTHDGEFITTRMTIDEVYAIRNRSESYKSGSGPWKSDENEMIKKTVVRRAYKSWPKTSTKSDRFEAAIDVTNEADPVDLVALPGLMEPSDRDKQISAMKAALLFLERTEEKYIAHLSTVNRREIKKLDDLTDLEISQAMIMLNQWMDQKKLKDAKPEVKNENAVAN